VEQFFDADERTKGVPPSGGAPQMGTPRERPRYGAPPKKRSAGRTVLLAFGILIVFGSFFLNLIFFFWIAVMGFRPSVSDSFKEVFISGDRHARDVVAVIEIDGVIMGDVGFGRDMVALAKRQLDMAGDDDRVKSVILSVDSPGGSMTATDILHKYVLEFKQKKKKKVVVLIKDLAASGGYYISAPADRIIAYPTAVTGSIGVIWPHYNYAGLFEKIGLQDKSIKSGDKKDMSSGSREMTPQERDIIKGIVMEMHQRFVKIVSDGRKLSMSQVEKLADGRVFSASQALKAGLIDKIGYFEEAEAAASELAGLTRYKVITYRKQKGFMESLLEGYQGRAVRNVSFEDLLPKGRVSFMCLWQPDY